MPFQLDKNSTDDLSIQSAVPYLEEHALGLAMMNFISCDNGFEGSWYDRYLYLSACVERSEDPDGWVPWQPFEDYDWANIVKEVEVMAVVLESSMKQILKFTHKGFVCAAIDDQLSLDATQWDMVGMLELGAAIESKQMAM